MTVSRGDTIAYRPAPRTLQFAIATGWQLPGCIEVALCGTGRRVWIGRDVIVKHRPYTPHPSLASAYTAQERAA